MKLIVLVYIYLSLKYCDCNDKTLLSKIKDIKVTIDHMPSVIIDDIEEPTGKQINKNFVLIIKMKYKKKLLSNSGLLLS